MIREAFGRPVDGALGGGTGATSPLPLRAARLGGGRPLDTAALAAIDADGWLFDSGLNLGPGI